MLQTTSQQDFGVSLADCLSALSMAIDLQMGFHTEHAIRVCYIGMRLADYLKLSEDEKRGVYYGAFLKDIGCSVTSASLAQMIAGDEIAMKRDMWLSSGSMGDVITKLLSHVDSTKPWPARIPKLINFLTHAPKAIQGAMLVRSDRARDIAAKLGLNRNCQEAVYCICERWDGKGHPSGLRGTFIPLPSRILKVGCTLEFFCAIGGRPAAEKAARERRGRELDPEIVDAFSGMATDSCWQEFQSPNLREIVIQMEPGGEKTCIDQNHLDAVIEAFADVVDVKSPFTGRHSTGVATVAEGLSKRLGLNNAQVREIRQAGLLHDLGKMSVPNSILDKPGKLDDSEWETVRLHSYYTQRILEQAKTLQELALIAGAHHEHLDGNGYPRGLKGQNIPLGARILAVADIFHAMSEDRPYRERMETTAILDNMAKEVGTHLDPEIFAALKTML